MCKGSRRCLECFKKGKNRGARLSKVKVDPDFKWTKETLEKQRLTGIRIFLTSIERFVLIVGELMELIKSYQMKTIGVLDVSLGVGVNERKL